MQKNSDLKNAQVMMPAENSKSKSDGKVNVNKQSGRTIWSRTWIYILIMGILTIVIFSQFFLSNQMLYSSDQVGGFDARVFYKDALVKFQQFPFWFSSRLGGMPTIDASFGDAMYPFSLIASSLFSIARAISIKMIFHVFLAGVFFFLMLRKGFGISPLVSLTGAIFYMLNPEFFSHIYPGHDGKMFVIAWLPFVIWRLKALMDKPSLLNVTLLSAGIGMSLLSSHIQMTYFVLWGMFFYWIIALVIAFRKKTGKKVIGMSVGFWCALFLGIGIALIQFLPTYLYVQHAYSVRGVERGFTFASSWSLHWPEFFSMWVPEFGNTLDYYWGQNSFKLNSEYAGAMAILLGALAIISKPTMWRIFWGSVAAFSILFSLGAHTPIFHIAYYIIPGVKKFRACSMIMFWFSFSTILLASLALKDILAGKFISLSESVVKKWTKGIVIAIVSCAALTMLFSIQEFVGGLFSSVLAETEKQNVFDVNFSKNFVPFLWLWFFFVAAALVSLIYVIRGKLKPSVFVVIVLIIGVIDLLRVDMQFVKLFDPAPYFNTEPALVPLQAEMKTAPFRCYSLPGALAQNSEGIHGLEGANGFHDNELRWYREYRGEQDMNYLKSIVDVDSKGQAYLSVDKLSAGSPLLNVANVKYFLVRNQGGELIPIKNKNDLGRVSFAQNYVVIDSSQIIPAIMNKSYDYKNTVALQSEPSVKYQGKSPVNSSFVSEWEKYTPNYRKVKVSVPSDGYLRISEVFYPGWKIAVDGNDSPIYKADLAYSAIPIKAGQHVIEIRAHSLYLKNAAIISLSIIILILIFWVVNAIIRLRPNIKSKIEVKEPVKQAL